MLEAPPALRVRNAQLADLEAIRRIYNQGIEDRVATLDEDPKDTDEMALWWNEHDGRYCVLASENSQAQIVGWAALNPYVLSGSIADSVTATLVYSKNKAASMARSSM